MVSQQYLILIDKETSLKIQDEFLEVIRSAYISKRAERYYGIFISADKLSSPQEIYGNVKGKLKNEVPFLVIRMDSYFGNLSSEAFDWIESTFPTVNLIK